MNLTPKNDQPHTGDAERLDRDDDLPRLGKWYWVKSKNARTDEEYEWLGCVMGIGSNYVLVESPHSSRGYYSSRVHVDELENLRAEPDADEVINKLTAKHQSNVNELIRKVGEITQSLGLRDTLSISADTVSEGESKAIATLSGQDDVKAYEVALIRAKTETLPELFKQIEAENEELSRWMKARTMPLQAQIQPLKSSIDVINDRIFSVSLYAGLTEEAVQCSEGEPAAITEKLHVLQRRCYMDEECLANYSAGGMDITGIEQFDEWIAVPENRDRILPFPRSMVAMQVRRKEKEREWVGAKSSHINIGLANADKLTFLYVKNGEQVWRIECEMDFGESIFPDKADFDPTEPMMLKTFAHSVDKFMPVREYEWRMEQYEEAKRKSEEWKRENPDKSWVQNPFGGGVGDYHMPGMDSFNPRDWKKLDFSNVHYDEAMDTVTKKVREYNRIALIIQGLFDRSPVLHPHLPVKSWTQEGFDRAIELVYDGNLTLYNGDRPDFGAYRDRINASMGPGSVVTGQEEHWLRTEAARENKKIQDNSRVRDKYYWKRYRPEGNPGPGMVGIVTDWRPRRREAVFEWRREKAWEIGTTGCSLAVPAASLLNVSAYKPGDYKQFFTDPRTRADYIQWAPLLLAAEDYHAGKISARDLDRIEQARKAGFEPK